MGHRGGDWADEPQLYAAVRHFYDPLALSGVHYLTDQSAAHGRYDQPMVDAATWALSATDNPFSWHEALAAYKRAMETPEDGQTPGEIRGSHFKLDIALHPKDRAEEPEMTGRLQGATLTGTANGRAWGVVDDAAEGAGSVRRH